MIKALDLAAYAVLLVFVLLFGYSAVGCTLAVKTHYECRLLGRAGGTVTPWYEAVCSRQTKAEAADRVEPLEDVRAKIRVQP